MRNIVVILWVVPTLLSALWLAANAQQIASASGFEIRRLLVHYTGVLSIGAMSVAMILATRAMWIERWVNGLDKSYRLHKWLGISALATSTVHWLMTQVPKWLVKFGVIDDTGFHGHERGAQGEGRFGHGGRHEGGAPSGDSSHNNPAQDNSAQHNTAQNDSGQSKSAQNNGGQLEPEGAHQGHGGQAPSNFDHAGPSGGSPEGRGFIQELLEPLHGVAVHLGEYAYYAAVVLITLALIKRFPYKTFASTHVIIAIAYLALVIHATVLLSFDVWAQPLGIVLALLMAGGVVSAVLALTRQIGRSNRVAGTITRIKLFPKVHCAAVTIALEPGWKGHKAGQFAFVIYDKKEGKHPFTIASAWDASTREVDFISKALGDYTNHLPTLLHEGSPAMVEGPYGRFTFEDKHDRQIWIGAGVGITPFIARLKQLANTSGNKSVDLIHSTREVSPAALALLEADAKAAGVTLHLLIEERDGFLTGERLRQMLPYWQSASFWFCGPAKFGDALREDLSANGLAIKHFHQELFSMR